MDTFFCLIFPNTVKWSHRYFYHLSAKISSATLSLPYCPLHLSFCPGFCSLLWMNMLRFSSVGLTMKRNSTWRNEVGGVGESKFYSTSSTMATLTWMDLDKLLEENSGLKTNPNFVELLRPGTVSIRTSPTKEIPSCQVGAKSNLSLKLGVCGLCVLN